MGWVVSVLGEREMVGHVTLPVAWAGKIVTCCHLERVCGA